MWMLPDRIFQGSIHKNWKETEKRNRRLGYQFFTSEKIWFSNGRVRVTNACEANFYTYQLLKGRFSVEFPSESTATSSPTEYSFNVKSGYDVLKFEVPCGGSLSKQVSPAYEEKFLTGTYLQVWILEMVIMTITIKFLVLSWFYQISIWIECSGDRVFSRHHGSNEWAIWKMYQTKKTTVENGNQY
jgi:hypothetical protein